MTIQIRPEKRLDNVDSQYFTVAASQSVRPGMGIKMASTDTSPATADFPQAQEATANTDDVLAIVDGDAGYSTFTAGQTFSAYLVQGTGVIPVLVGTGNATRGAMAVATTNGFTDAPANGNATTRVFSVGTFMRTGVAGDIVPVLIRARAINKT